MYTYTRFSKQHCDIDPYIWDILVCRELQKSYQDLLKTYEKDLLPFISIDMSGEVWDPLIFLSKEAINEGIDRVGINHFLEVSETSAFKMIEKLEIYLWFWTKYDDDTYYNLTE